MDGDRIRKILRILDSDQVNLAQKEQILKAFIPTIDESNMDLKQMLKHLLDYTKA